VLRGGGWRPNAEGETVSLFRRVLLLLLRFCVIIIYCALNYYAQLIN
jgi:hypothetical protein